MVTLKNKRRQMKTFNLDARFFTKNQNETPYGQPCVLTFLALEKKEGVHDAVLSCAEVQAALEAGDLRILDQKPGNPGDAPKAAPEAKVEKKASTKKK